MKILHVQGQFSPEHGGLTFALANWARGQVRQGHQVALRVLEGWPHSSPALRLEPPVDMFVGNVGFPAKLGRSPELKRKLAADPDFEVYHLHGAWLSAMDYGAREARRRQRPYLVELAGTYEPYSLQQKWLRKGIARRLYQDRLLHEAGCLHAASHREAGQLRDLGFRAPIAVIPPGVDTRSVSRQSHSEEEEALAAELQGAPFFLYLARVHPKKGIELLLQAWAPLSARHPDWRVVIAGAGAPDYVAGLQKLAADLGLSDRCHWLGQVTAAQKAFLYAKAACYILPTYSENFGNTVVEALSMGTPVITTDATPWEELPGAGCGWIGQPAVGPMREAMAQAVETGPGQLRVMGQRGRELVQQKYSVDYALDALEKTYGWLLGGAKPKLVLG